MQIRICAVGRMRAGPEKELVADYLTRFERTGRAFGLGPAIVQEVDERKARDIAAQGEALARLIPDKGYTCAMDERGRVLSSVKFASMMRDLADQGQPELVFLIGGADGLDPKLRDNAKARLSFGAMVWPHMLCRVMLAEQLYRAATILAGSPYHRGD